MLPVLFSKRALPAAVIISLRAMSTSSFVFNALPSFPSSQTQPVDQTLKVENENYDYVDYEKLSNFYFDDKTTQP